MTRVISVVWPFHADVNFQLTAEHITIGCCMIIHSIHRHKDQVSRVYSGQQLEP